MGTRVLIGLVAFAMVTIIGGGAARAADADVVRTVRLDDGGRIEFYRDGEFACFDGNDRPTADAKCQSIKDQENRRQAAQREAIEKEESERKEQSMALEQELVTATVTQLYLKAGQGERNGENRLAARYYESIIKRFPDHDLAIKANDQLLNIHRIEQIRDSNDNAAYRQQKALEEASQQARVDAENARERANNACYSRRSACKSNCGFLDTRCDNACESICSVY